MIYIFNEASASPLPSAVLADQMLETFIKALISAEALGLIEFRLHVDTLPSLFTLPLAPQYNIDKWLSNPDINEDLKTRFRDIIFKYPLVDQDDEEEDELYQRSEYFFQIDEQKVRVWGLGAAYVMDTLSISLRTNPAWTSTSLSVDQYLISPEGEETTAEVQVRNFHTAVSLETHRPWIERTQLDFLTTSTSIWEQRAELFPNLIFIAEVEDQLKKIGVSKALTQIFNRLKALNNYAPTWTAGGFSVDDVNENTNLRISLESDLTMRSYGAQRRFKLPDTHRREFFIPHIKTGMLRFHFYPDEASKKIYIGYIGKHLRIFSEN